MKNDYTHVSIVLDRSRSMAAIASDTIGGFNQFIKSQQELPGQCSLTLVQFDSQGIDTIYNAVPVGSVKPLEFLPRGGTPLYDAIGQTINATGKFLKDKPDRERPAKVVFVIITDGYENSSREFDQARVFEMIKHQREAYKWEFVFIGANQNAFEAGQGIGVAAANCYSNVQNSEGTHATYGALGSNLCRMRSAEVNSAECTMSFTQAQHNDQIAAGLDPELAPDDLKKKKK
jgi:hypothetical protein